MFGGLKKTTSRLAIAAAAGMFMGGMALTPAQAADLGGDCCADLEERVAELEATTVRKGNRHVSVKVSGQINYVMLYWDDGADSDVYIGDNISSSTRFRFTGAAKFKPGWSAGFVLEIQAFSAASSAFDQKRDGDPFENADGGLSMRKAAWYIKSDRLGEIWLGRYSPATDDIKLLNVAGTPHVDASLETAAGFYLRAPSGTGGCQGSGCLYNITLGSIAPGGDTRRGEVIRYNTPSLAGFVFSVSWGEDDIFDVAVRYKKEWNSIRVVGGIGYHWDVDEDEDTIMLTCGGVEPGRFANTGSGTPVATGIQLAGANNAEIFNTSINNPGIGVGNTVLQADNLWDGCRDYRFDLERLAGSFSAMHTPSGIYAYFGGHRDSWGSLSAFNSAGTITAANVDGRRTGGGATSPNSASHWYVQLGIKRRMGPFRNLGQTTLYGEYQEWDGWLKGTLSTAFGPSSVNTAPANINFLNQIQALLPGNTPQYVQTDPNNNLFRNGTAIVDSSVTSWGFGAVQNIDKAAMELWIGYRRFSPDVRTQTVFNAGTECQTPQPNTPSAANAAAGNFISRTPIGGAGACRVHPQQLPTSVVVVDHALEELWHVNVGGRLKF